MENNKEHKMLFNEFPPISTETWMDRVKADYKTDDPLSKINWKTGEGIDIKGIFRQEDIENLDYLNNSPGEFPFTRGTKTHNDWIVNANITEADINIANTTALKSISRGATSVEFNFEKANSFASVSSLLNGINIEEIQIIISKAEDINLCLDYVMQYVTENKIDKSKINIIFNVDFLETRLTTGNYNNNAQESFESKILFVKRVIENNINIKAISIKGNLYHDAGSTVVQELAFTLSSAIEQINILQEAGIKIKDILNTISFRMAIGSSYFIEIAKFRAIRYLFAKAVEAFDNDNKDSAKAYILAQSSKWNKSIYDPYVNMLRTTTETMSAAISGVDIISVNNFDNAYDNDSIFARRISQNQQIVIKEEAHFDKVVDAAGGSYYIENLTDELINNVWKLFLEIEGEGGYKVYLDADKIKNDIEKSAEKKLLNVATRRLNILGTNQFPNQEEFMIDDIKKEIKDDAAGLQMRRATEEFDTIRLETEKFEKENGKRPLVQLISFGNMAMRKARAGFISNFFACAAYDIVEDENCQSASKATELIKKADLTILCSSDDEYLDFITEVSSLLANNDNIILIAGNPKNAEELKTAGATDFIHVRTNVLECLKSYNNRFYKRK